MSWQSSIFILLCLAVSTQCREPVVIKRIPTLADFNLTAPILTADELKMFHEVHSIRLRANHYCKYRPRERFYPTETEKKVTVFEVGYPFYDREIAVLWLNEGARLNEIIEDSGNVYHTWLQVYYKFDFKCPNSCAGTWISIVNLAMHSFTNREATEHRPWQPTERNLSKQCDGPRDANGTRYRDQVINWKNPG